MTFLFTCKQRPPLFPAQCAAMWVVGGTQGATPTSTSWTRSTATAWSWDTTGSGTTWGTTSCTGLCRLLSNYTSCLAKDAVLWIRNDFFRIRILLLVGFGSYRVFFSNILNINFTFVLPSCKCVKLHIMMIYKFFRGIFYEKKFIFLTEHIR